MTRLNVDGTKIRVWSLDTFTSGQIGAKVEFQFSSDWDGLSKAAVFEAHESHRTGDCHTISATVLESEWDGNVCYIPSDVLETPGYELLIGVYGFDSAGNIVIPTVYAKCGRIARGARSSETYPSGGALPIWAQLQNSIGNLDDLETTDKQNLVAAINELVQNAGSGGGGSSGSGGGTSGGDDTGGEGSTGTGVAATYTYTQGAASENWTVKHNLGTYPSVTIIDSGGNVVVGDVKYISSNEISISFAGAFSGKAYLN